jgi:hypothetical protein
MLKVSRNAKSRQTESGSPFLPSKEVFMNLEPMLGSNCGAEFVSSPSLYSSGTLRDSIMQDIFTNLQHQRVLIENLNELVKLRP